MSPTVGGDELDVVHWCAIGCVTVVTEPLAVGSAPQPVPHEVHGHRDTGEEERRDTPRRRVTTPVPGRVREHAGR